MYNGQIKGIPAIIIDKLMEYQAQQGNVPDHTLFERNIQAGDESGGVTWSETPEGHAFWSRTLIAKNFHEFFLKFGIYELNYTSNASNKVAAHVKTPEEVRIIDSILGLNHFPVNESFLYSKEQQCINLSSNKNCNLSHYKDEGYIILEAQDFINYHKNKQNGKEPNTKQQETGSNETQPISERGTAIRISSPTRQITVGSRPVGNPTSAGIRKTKIGNSEISGEAITF